MKSFFFKRDVKTSVFLYFSILPKKNRSEVITSQCWSFPLRLHANHDVNNQTLMCKKGKTSSPSANDVTTVLTLKHLVVECLLTASGGNEPMTSGISNRYFWCLGAFKRARYLMSRV